MRNILNKAGVLLIAASLLFIGCKDDDDNDDKYGGSVTSIVVENATDNTISLFIGDTHSVITKLLPEDAPDKDKYTLRYKSSNEEVFTVDENGLLTAIDKGVASLRVESIIYPDIWTTVAIKVTARTYPVTSITIAEKYRDFYMKTQETFNLKDHVTVSPDNATEPEVLYISSDDMIAEVDIYGVVTTHALGDVTITVKSVDGSNISAECNIHIRNISYTYLNRAGWEVIPSYRWFADTNASVKGTPESLIDGNNTSVFSLVKPGKSNLKDNDNYIHTIPSNAIPYFILDMKEEKSFSVFRLIHRSTADGLRLRKLSIYGSNDNTVYTPLAMNISVQVDLSVYSVIGTLPETFTYRYVKVVYEDWNKSTSNSIQISEFYLGMFSYDPIEP